MLNFSAMLQIFAYLPSTDMRKGFAGLSAIIREEFQADPTNCASTFGDTDEAADAAEGLASSLEEADLNPELRHRRRKKRDESLPTHESNDLRTLLFDRQTDKEQGAIRLAQTLQTP